MRRAESQTLITGCYRSGTEYITQLLGNQPDLVTTMYVTNFMRYYWGEYDPIDEPENYHQLVFDAARRTRRRWDRQIDPHRILNAVEERESVSYGLLYDLMMVDLFLSEGDASHWAEKTQLVWTQIPEFVDAFDDGRAILITRDPRSVLASFKNYTYEPEPAYLGAIFNMLDVFRKATEYERELDDEQFHLLRYEDVISDPEETLIETFGFLDLSHNHDLLSEEGWTDASGDLWKTNTAFDDEEFDVEAAVNRWKHGLEPWEVSLCEWVVEDVMTEYGYEPSGAAPPDDEHVDVMRNDAELRQYLRRWQETGEGVESFPSDPTDPDNWEENAKES